MQLQRPKRQLRYSTGSIIRSEADPYLLAGVLSEAVAAIVAQRVPVERQQGCGRMGWLPLIASQG
jgi:hypothetical protein